MIAHYRVVRLLGSGGMGEVYLAEDTRLERSVALKVMSRELARDLNHRKRFRTEAKSASNLAHPHICVIHEVGETEEGRPFLAMEYVEGTTLDKLVQQRRLTPKEVVHIGIQAAEALDAAHHRGVVHRDIKTSNLIMDRRGHIKVLDFGLAKRLPGDELSAATTSVPQTQTGVLLGTPHYMSPEQALGREIDHRTDIFSLGVVLYELAVGQRPFLGRTVGETVNNVINQQPQPLGLENPGVSAALEAIIFKCLEKEPEKRFSSAHKVSEELAGVRRQLEQAGTVSKPVSPPTPAPAPATPAPAHPFFGRRAIAFAVLGLILLVLSAGAFLWHPPKWLSNESSRQRLASSNAAPPNSVAVLPFNNISSEPDTEYLSDGLTEEITTALSRVRGLKVAARNSAFTFKGKQQDARAIGATLGVSALLEGSVRKAGQQIRVTAQLINAADGFQLWSESYDRSLKDIFGVQEDIARRIADRLQSGSSATVESPRTLDPEAHMAYLRARLFWNRRTEDSLNQAADLFKAALQKDPGYAAAEAGLAATYYLLPMYSLEAKRTERLRLAREAANHALELDPACAEAHTVLANLQASAQDYKGAEEHFRRALQLDPNYATAHHWYGQYLQHQGRAAQGLAELQIAADLDPLSPIIRSAIPGAYYMAGDYERAIAETRKVITAFPDFPAARTVLIMAELMKGDYREALKEIDDASSLEPSHPLGNIEFKGFAFARLGERPKAEAVLTQLEEQRRLGKPVDGAMGFVYVGLRDYDKALDCFERLVATDGLDPEVVCQPLFKEMLNLPRAQALLKKAGVQPEHDMSTSNSQTTAQTSSN